MKLISPLQLTSLTQLQIDSLDTANFVGGEVVYNTTTQHIDVFNGATFPSSIPLNTSDHIIFPIMGYVINSIPTNTHIISQTLSVPVTFAISCPDSIFRVETPPSDEVVFTIYHQPNGGVDTTIGTITFASGSSIGSLIFSSAVSINVLGSIKIQSPNDTFGMLGLFISLQGSSNIPIINV